VAAREKPGIPLFSQTPDFAVGGMALWTAIEAAEELAA